MEMDRIVDQDRDPEGAARRRARYENERGKLIALCGAEIGAALALVLEAQRAVIRKSIFCWSVMEGGREIHQTLLARGAQQKISESLAAAVTRQVGQEERALAQFVEAFEALEDVPPWEDVEHAEVENGC